MYWNTLHPRILQLFMLVCASCYAYGQPTTTNPDRFYRENITSLLNDDSTEITSSLVTSFASLHDRRIEDIPGTITILTREHIEACGARDIMEALSILSGISFGRNKDDVTGIGIRGLWAQEGKCLYLLNGIPMNELEYGTFDLFNRIPMQGVERIEVITGPGSVVYGGYAALGVVNIVTTDAGEREYIEFNSRTAYANPYLLGNYFGVAGNHFINTETQLSFNASFANTLRSAWTDSIPDGRWVAFGDSTQVHTDNSYLSIRHKGFEVKMVMNDHEYQVSDGTHGIRTRNTTADISQKFSIGDSAWAEVGLNWTKQLPKFYTNTTDEESLFSNSTVNRYMLKGALGAYLNPSLSATCAIQAYRQMNERMGDEEGYNYMINGQSSIAVTDLAVMEELTLVTRFGSLSAGFRFETNTFSKSVIAPRVSYTHHLGTWHWKVSTSRAFKIPTVGNVNNGPTGLISTEYSNVVESEVGVKIHENTSLIFNGFISELENPIVFVFDNATLDNYVNRARAATEGMEIRFNSSFRRLKLWTSGALYRVRQGNSELAEFELPEPYRAAYQGMPQHKATMTGRYRITSSWYLNAHAIYSGPMQSYQYCDLNMEKIELIEYPSYWLCGAWIEWHPPGKGGLSVKIGGNNLLNEKMYVVSPNRDGAIPLPMYMRELNLELTFALK